MTDELFIDPSRLGVGRELGEGGFGTVKAGILRAQDGRGYEQVAIKHSSGKDKQGMAEEASKTISLSRSCENMVECYGHSVLPDGHHCLVMKAYEHDLFKLIDQGGSPLPLHDILQIGLDVAKGLQQLHAKEVIYQDLKPSNVLIGPQGQAVLADFGLSRFLSQAQFSHASTYNPKGTRLFMSPEQVIPINEEGKVNFGYPSDVFSFGIMMCQLVTSNPLAPYRDAGWRQHRDGELENGVFYQLLTQNVPTAPLTPDMPAGLHALITKCLSLDPSARPTAPELVARLRHIQESLPAPPQPAPGPAQPARPAPDPSPARLTLCAKPECTATLTGHEDEIKSMAISRDGGTLFTGSRDKTVRVWDVQSGTCTTLSEHADGVNSVALSLNGLRLATGSHDETTKVWDLQSHACVATLPGPGAVRSVALNGDGTRVAMGMLGKATDPTAVWIYDVRTGAQMSTLERKLGGQQAAHGHAGTVNSVAFSDWQGTTCFSGSRDRTVRIWDVWSGACVAVLEGHKGGVNSLALSADGRTLITASDDRTARIWDVESGKCTHTLSGHNGSVMSVAFNGTTCVTGARDGTARITDVRVPDRTCGVVEHAGRVQSVALSRDGATCATGSSDSTARVWRLSTKKRMRSTSPDGPHMRPKN